MSYLKFSKYLYLIISVYFVYDIIVAWNTNRNHAYLSMFLLALAVFMFFFRRNFDNKNKSK